MAFGHSFSDLLHVERIVPGQEGTGRFVTNHTDSFRTPQATSGNGPPFVDVHDSGHVRTWEQNGGYSKLNTLFPR
jgi:hypothetical protein